MLLLMRDDLARLRIRDGYKTQAARPRQCGGSRPLAWARTLVEQDNRQTRDWALIQQDYEAKMPIAPREVRAGNC